MKNSASNSLVYLFNGKSVCCGSLLLVTGINSDYKLLDNSAKLSLEDLVAKSLSLNNLYTLLCGFDIRQNFHLLIIFDVLMLHERVQISTNSFTKIFYHIVRKIASVF